MIDGQYPRPRDRFMVLGLANAQVGEERQQRSFHLPGCGIGGVPAEIDIGQTHVRRVIEFGSECLACLEPAFELQVAQRCLMLHGYLRASTRAPRIRIQNLNRKSTRLNSSHYFASRMPSS